MAWEEIEFNKVGRPKKTKVEKTAKAPESINTDRVIGFLEIPKQQMHAEPEKASIALNEIVKIAMPLFWTVEDLIRIYFQEKYNHNILFEGNEITRKLTLDLHIYERQFREITENPE